MPQKTIFIRDEDLDKWKAVEKKSEFIHNALNGSTLESAAARALPVIQKMDKELSLKEKASFLGAAYIAGSEAYEKTCKHGFPPDTCKYAKPGKPCK